MEVANVSPKTDCQTQGVLKIPVVIGLKMAYSEVLNKSTAVIKVPRPQF